MDYSGRQFDVTPFQAALLAHNVDLWEKMEIYFGKLPDGQAEKARQFKEVFPNGMPAQKPYDFSKLVQVITNSTPGDIQAAREKRPNNTPLWQALENFRNEFTALSMKEKYFNPQHLIEAFNVYAQQYSLWSWEQLSLFWCQIIGYSQRFLPEPYVRILYQGCEQVIFSLQPSSGLGFDFGVYNLACGVDGGDGGGVTCMGTCRWCVDQERSVLKNFVEQIHQSFVGLSASCCVLGRDSLGWYRCS
ncbi:TPA: hypothetical protein JBJ29_10995 [Legionella pneumophila]|nr:hypothetical protein [Legionella pneumophila]